ncbi:TPA: IS481 family transposase, partial [Escherichia coli]|nr:IS481 family transposase [Escherichia coli]
MLATAILDRLLHHSTTLNIKGENYAVAFPAHGQHRTSNELRKQGVFISGSGVRSVWLRH